MTKPRHFPRELIPYLGLHARKGFKLRYTVSGRGRLPDDMLRYDDANVLSPVEQEENHALHEVRIVHAEGCTAARWSSFGWSVHDDVTEYVPER